MSKMSELSQVLEEMIVCGEGMIKAANTLKDIFSSTEEAPAKTDPAPTYTKEDVRGVLAAKSAAGFKKEVKDLLEKFGAQQLKQIDPKDYAALLKEAEAERYACLGISNHLCFLKKGCVIFRINLL